MKPLTTTDKNKLLRIAKVVDAGDAALIQEVFELEDKIDVVNNEVKDALKEVSDAVTQTKKLVEDVKKMEGPSGYTPVKGKDYVDGKDYILTTEDKKYIAEQITVPVIEKVIEKTTVVKEQPIVTEITQTVENSVKAEEIVIKLESLKEDDRLDVSAIKGLDTREKKLSSDTLSAFENVLDHRTSYLINKVSNLQNQVNRLPTTGGGSAPGGSDGQLQYRVNGTTFGGMADTFYTPSAAALPGASHQVTFGRSIVFQSDNDLSDSVSILYINNGKMYFADDNNAGALIANIGVSMDSDGAIEFNNTTLSSTGLTSGHWNFNTGPVNIGGHVVDVVPLGKLEVQFEDPSFGKNTRLISGNSWDALDGVGSSNGSSALYTDVQDGSAHAGVFLSSYSDDGEGFYGVASMDSSAINFFMGKVGVGTKTPTTAVDIDNGTYTGNRVSLNEAVVSSLATPTAGTFTTLGTGGTLAKNTTYWYRVSATDTLGETLAFAQVSKLTGNVTTTNTITVVWNKVTGATGYKVYGRTNGAELLIATISSGSTLSYTDTGSVTPSGALPTENTTGRIGIHGTTNSTLMSGKMANFTTLFSPYSGFAILNNSGQSSFEVSTNGVVGFFGSECFFAMGDRVLGGGYGNVYTGGFYKNDGIFNFWNNSLGRNTMGVADNGDTIIGVNDYGTYSGTSSSSTIGAGLIVDKTQTIYRGQLMIAPTYVGDGTIVDNGDGTVTCSDSNTFLEGDIIYLDDSGTTITIVVVDDSFTAEYTGDGGSVSGSTYTVTRYFGQNPLEIYTSGSSGQDTIALRQTSAASGNYYSNLTFYNTNGLIGNIFALGDGYNISAIFGPNDMGFLGGQGHDSTNMIFMTNTNGDQIFGAGGYATTNEVMRVHHGGTLNIRTTVGKYKNIATVSNGIPSELATIDSTGLTGNVGATTLYAVPSTGEGMYRVSAYLVTTTAGSVSSTMPNAQVVFTDKDSNTTVTLDVSPVLGAAGLGQSGLLTANTVGTVFSGSVPIYVKASTTIQYKTVNYASTAAGMAYALRIKLEAL
jgi:hypothetical protein